LVTEINQIYNDWMSLSIRLYKNSKYVEFQWQIGPIDVSDMSGKEAIFKLSSDLASSLTYYTDSNGREMLKRVRNIRPTWPNFNQSEPISGNYYPVNTRIFIRDEEDKERRQLTVVTDRTHSGGSIQDGSIEIMLHRRMLYDDALGVDEPLNETGIDQQGLIARGTFYLFFNSSSNSARLHREMGQKVNLQPLITFNKQSSWNSNANLGLSNWSPLSGTELPPNLHLLTFAKDYDHSTQNAYIVRIEHFYEQNEDPEYSKPIKFDLQKFFNTTLKLVGIEELALGANFKSEILDERLTWNFDNSIQDHSSSSSSSSSSYNKDPFVFDFEPMQIRTFRVWLI
jgi:lysosomal alpha-mannosidase